jgi:hypothetical protein
MFDSLVSADCSGWDDAVLAVPHDVYHLARYAKLCGALEGGEAQGFIARDGHCRLFVPLIVRRVPSSLCNGDGSRDATVPYGYPGPLLSCDGASPGAPASTFLDHALEALVTRLRKERIVSAFFRLHPLLPVETAVLSRFGSVVRSGETVAIDLSLSEDALWRQMRPNHRRDVTKAKARGEWADIDPTWSALPLFVQAYRETMSRVGADSYYLFSDDYFLGLRDALQQHLHLWVVRSDGEVTAGALFTECGGIVQYHLGGTLDRFLPENPMKLLFHSATAWFRQRGNRWLHLGGGVGSARDSLMHFKLGFSGLTFPFYTWRVVIDPDMYGELLARVPRDTPVDAPSSFFPAYRQPAG